MSVTPQRTEPRLAQGDLLVGSLIPALAPVASSPPMVKQTTRGPVPLNGDAAPPGGWETVTHEERDRAIDAIRCLAQGEIVSGITLSDVEAMRDCLLEASAALATVRASDGACAACGGASSCKERCPRLRIDALAETLERARPPSLSQERSLIAVLRMIVTRLELENASY